MWSFYGQDSWHATSKLTLNYGVRSESASVPGRPIIGTAALTRAFRIRVRGNPGAVTFWGPGAGRNGRTRLLDGYYGALGPRLGIAYAWNPAAALTRAYSD